MAFVTRTIIHLLCLFRRLSPPNKMTSRAKVLFQVQRRGGASSPIDISIRSVPGDVLLNTPLFGSALWRV